MNNKKNINLNPDELMPKSPTNRAPVGIKTFTMYRQSDETGVSGVGIVTQGVILASGWCVVNWLLPSPKGSLAVFDSIRDFLQIHVESHPTNNTIITFSDGEQHIYKQNGTKEVRMLENKE